MSNPYLIEGPALISFSGGRTSAYMLYQILQAHGGTLPDDVVVAFANTGKEREETLRFVHECEAHWGVRVHWIEWERRKPWHRVVSFETAARNGEPFIEAIKTKQRTPNGMMRFCTEKTKVEALSRFAEARFGQGVVWANVVGLRHDEGHRLLKAYAKNAECTDRSWRTVCPMDKAKAARRDVMAFWAKQNFDLQLRSYEGNCDLCFLKGRGILKTIIRENPGLADWWIEIEDTIGNGTFRSEGSYRDLVREVEAQPFLFEPEDEHDVECGLWCAPDQEAA